MRDIEGQIQFYRQDTIRGLMRELEPFFVGENLDLSYYNWYSQLSDIRKYFFKMIYEHQPSWEHPYLLNGHRLDHHTYGYIAPLEIYRKGFLDQVRTPAEQLSFLSQQFHEHGIRFIYAALPCKKAVYPEIVLPESLLGRGHSGVIPQWRHMLYDLICHGVEVVDLYPYFRHYRENNHLFSYGHDVSCTGATLIGNILGTYLQNTTEDIRWPDAKKLFTARPCNVTEDNIKYQTEQISFAPAKHTRCENGASYKGTEVTSEIGIFGNCNLQKYRGSGIDITAQLSNCLSYPVNYLGRLLTFSFGADEIADAADGAFWGKKIVIYLGFPSAAFVRSPWVGGSWCTRVIPERCFNKPAG